MDLREIAAAYQSIYLSEEVEEEGVKQIVFEDLSQEEVDNFVEEIVDELFEEGFSIEDIEEAFNDYIDEECSFLTEARAAKRQPGASQGPRPKRKSLMQSQREKLAAQKAKSEARKGAAMIVRPSSALATKPKGGAITKSKGSAITKSKGGELAKSSKSGALAKTETKKGAVTKAVEKVKVKVLDKKKSAITGSKSKTQDSLPSTRTVTKGEKRTAERKAAVDQKRAAAEKRKADAAKGSTNVGPATPVKGSPAKAEVKSGVRKALTYRGKGAGKKEFIGKKEKVVKVDARAKQAKDNYDRAMAADKEQDRLNRSKREKVKSAVKSAGRTVTQGAKDAVKSGVKKARNFVGGALGKLADKVKSEGIELDSFDTVVAYLIDEEIASDFTEATAMMAKLSEETVAKIHSSQLQLLDEAVYGGGKKEEKKDTRMIVTNADKKGNTPAYQNYMKGDKRYKAADHMKGDK